MENNLNYLESELKFTENIKYNLEKICYWTKFFCIFGCVVVAFLVLFGIGGMAFSNFIPAMTQGAGTWILVIYLVVAALYIYPIKKGYAFIDKARLAMRNKDQAAMEDAFANNASIYRYFGILSIIALVLYALGFIMIFASVAITNIH